MEQEIKDLKELVAKLLAKVDELTLENQDLRHRLAKYENPKNSNNSSIPPSQDPNRIKRKSLREKTNKKVGGQIGRKGNTLKKIENPDSIVHLSPDFCSCCGENLEHYPVHSQRIRQVFDIPKIELKVTQYQTSKKRCICGTMNSTQFPEEANAPVSYGNNIESLIGYFHTRQFLPFKRMKEMFNDVFCIPISEGGLHYILDKLIKKAQPAYELIKKRVQESTKYAVGSDETGMKVNGDKYWAWTWQNEEATFITITDNRAQKTITDTVKEGFKNAVLVHDCWSSHFNTPAITHQICIAHLLRDLNYLTELYNNKWSKALKLLFQLAIKHKQNMSKVDFFIPNYRTQQLEKRLDYLLNYNFDSDKKELKIFQNRLNKYRDYIFVFLYRDEVPPDNNASERAIRNVKIKQKISGQFKSPHGAFRFAVLRSITDTTLKNNMNVINALKLIASL